MNNNDKYLSDLYNKSKSKNAEDQIADVFQIIQENEENYKKLQQRRTLNENNIWSEDNIAKKETKKQEAIDKAKRIANQPKHIYKYGQNRIMNTTEDAVIESLFGGNKNR
tara:strand:- start:771 stop:1100 length:330 start_codon:yes stop_codon:yes gene_type:complete